MWSSTCSSICMHNMVAKNPLVLTLVQYLPTFCIGSCRHNPYLLVRCWRLPQSQQAAVVCTAHQRVFTSRVGRQGFAEPHRAKSAAAQPSHRQSACRVGQHKQLSAVTTAYHSRLQHYWYILAPLTCVCISVHHLSRPACILTLAKSIGCNRQDTRMACNI